MIWAEIDGVPVDLEANDDDDVNHIVCCDDDNIALCGLDLTEVGWVPRGATPDCPTCERLDAKDEAAGCYEGHCDHCPRNVLGGLS